MFKNTDQDKTLERLTKAMQRQHPVTLSYVKEGGEEVLRTIEIYEIPEELTQSGKQLIRAMDRAGNVRTWRLDRIKGYQIHRSRYIIPRCPEHNRHPEDCAYRHGDVSVRIESECYDLHQAYIHYAVS